MKVLFITEEDVFYVRHFFSQFYPLARRAPYTVDAVSILRPFNKRSVFALARQMLSFYGPINFVRMGVLYVFKKARGDSVEGLTRREGITLLPVRNVNSPAYIEEVKRRGIDLIVSIAAPQIFRRELISCVPRGCINSHSAILPLHRGMMPIFWALYHGDREVGVTIHYIDENIDNGDIIAQERISVVGDESLHEMILKTKALSARMVDTVLRAMFCGPVAHWPMPQGGSYHSFPSRADVAEFLRRGKRIF